MRLRTRLIVAITLLTALTLGVSFIGLVQTRALSSALYEIGVVRLPSIEGLNKLKEALTALSDPRITPDQERKAMALAADGFAIYEPLPQTPEESARWKEFGSAWNEWKATSSPDSLANARTALNEAIAINQAIVREEKRKSISSSQDAKRVQRITLIGALVMLLASIVTAIALATFITKPIENVAKSLGTIAQGDFSVRLNPHSHDEIGEVARATNKMAEALARGKKAEEAVRVSRQQLRVLAGKLQAVREEERIRIAREIHDVLAQELTRIKIDLGLLGNGLRIPIQFSETEASEKIKIISSLVDSSIQSVQKIASELRPAVLDSLGLTAAIESNAQDFQQRTGIQCDVLVVEDGFQLSNQAATNVFRIVQESLTNVARHAKASRVEIILERNRDELRLIIEDNGLGFNSAKLNDPQSLGLIGMRERANMLDGDFEIRQRGEGGTRIIVSFPLEDSEKQTSTERASNEQIA